MILRLNFRGCVDFSKSKVALKAGKCYIREDATRTVSAHYHECVLGTRPHSSQPTIFLSLGSLSTLPSMISFTFFLTIVDLSVAHQFPCHFTKSFKFFIKYLIWWNFFSPNENKVSKFINIFLFLLQWWFSQILDQFLIFDS